MLPDTLVLGGAGFLGRFVVRALARLGAGVRVLDRHAAGHDALPAGRWFVGDLSDRAVLRVALAGCGAVVHLAAGASPATSEDDWAFDAASQLLPAIGLVEAMHGAGVRRLVFVSSGGTVYGDGFDRPIREDDVTAPIAAYGLDKLLVEHCLGYATRTGRVDAIVLRVANAYGVGQDPSRGQGVIGAFIAAALAGRPLRVFGDGEAVRDFVHASDVAEAVVAALGYRGAQTTFNVGSGEGRSVDGIIAELEHALGRRLPVERGVARRFDVHYNVLDSSRAARELGWRPGVAFDAGLAATIAWHRGE